MVLGTKLRRRVERLSGSLVERRLRPYEGVVERVESWAELLANESELELRQRARRLRDRADESASSEGTLEELFALAAEAAARTLGQRPFREQLLAGVAMHRGRIAEMQTGEGKTLAAVAPVALHALGGLGAHVLTFNDYLARRDAEWMGPVYQLLGLSVGFVQESMSNADRRHAYGCDVTYVTAKEAGFDYLRGCLCLDPAEVVHRAFSFALVDEADSILIDEARVPLVIAGDVTAPATAAVRMSELALRLKRGVHYDWDEHRRNVFFTEVGIEKVEELLGCGALHETENLGLLADLQNALHAELMLERDVDYIVRQGRIELVDDFTGRVADRRQWPDGLQGAIEAKERVRIRDEGRILGSITVQHFLGGYDHLCGMTATALPAAAELEDFYGLGVVVIPTHEPCLRIDHPDLVFTDRAVKGRALIDEICRVHADGRPLLVGTASVAESEDLAARLTAAGVPFRLLNAKDDSLEAEIVADAGRPGAVTISTNMAGRGTDIRLGGRDESARDGVVASGGLYVIGTNRHESRRIDQQLRGRAGRQGDPGSSRFFISLEDPLVERFGIRNLVTARHLPESQPGPIDKPLLRREIDRVQRIIEGENHSIRKKLWSYSEPLDRQRQSLQAWRREVLEGVTSMDLLARRTPQRWTEARELVGAERLEAIERRLTLLMIDRCWSDYLAEMAQLRDGIHVVELGGRDPLTEYFREAGDAFMEMEERIDDEVVATFEQLEITAAGVDWEAEGLLGPSSTWTFLVGENPFGANTLQSLAHRPGAALFGVAILGPLLFLWGLREHWMKRKKRSELR